MTITSKSTRFFMLAAWTASALSGCAAVRHDDVEQDDADAYGVALLQMADLVNEGGWEAISQLDPGTLEEPGSFERAVVALVALEMYATVDPDTFGGVVEYGIEYGQAHPDATLSQVAESMNYDDPRIVAAREGLWYFDYQAITEYEQHRHEVVDALFDSGPVEQMPPRPVTTPPPFTGWVGTAARPGVAPYWTWYANGRPSAAPNGLPRPTAAATVGTRVPVTLGPAVAPGVVNGTTAPTASTGVTGAVTPRPTIVTGGAGPTPVASGPGAVQVTVIGNGNTINVGAGTQGVTARQVAVITTAATGGGLLAYLAYLHFADRNPNAPAPTPPTPPGSGGGGSQPPGGMPPR
jgi:hypothetical protein